MTALEDHMPQLQSRVRLSELPEHNRRLGAQSGELEKQSRDLGDGLLGLRNAAEICIMPPSRKTSVFAPEIRIMPPSQKPSAFASLGAPTKGRVFPTRLVIT